MKLPPECDEQFFSLLNTYLTEWCHRDDIMWKHVFAYFYAALVVIIAPYTDFISKEYAENIRKACYYVGYMLPACMLYAGISYGIRLSRIGDQYRYMIKMLPPSYQNKYLNKTNLLLKQRLAYVIPVVMTAALIALNVLVKHFLL